MSIFSKVPRGRLVRNRYNMSYPTKFTMQTGLLYPVYLEETVPGDIFRAGSGFVIRSQPMIAPLMSSYFAEMRYFYVPNRLVWDQFQDFIMDQVRGVAELTKFAGKHPYIAYNSTYDTGTETAPGTIYDYLNVPYDYPGAINILPFLAYNMIWNEYYRDQNLQDAVQDKVKVGVSAYHLSEFSMLRANWKKDYFTSALPWTQRGNAVNLPADVILRSIAEQEALGLENGLYQRVKTVGGTVLRPEYVDAAWTRTGSSASINSGQLRSIDPEQLGYSDSGESSPGGLLGYLSGLNSSNQAASVNTGAIIDPNGTLGVNIDIRDLRFATAVQRFLEREAQVGGGRYADWLRGVYGVNIGDATLQRPMYLGGGRLPVNVSPVEQTSMTPDGDGTPQGNLAGKGYMSGLFRFNGSTLLSEHGWVIGMLCIRPQPLYYRGISRHMIKRDRFDYMIPGFERLGEQEIFNGEVYAIGSGSSQDADTLNMGTFSYTSRQAEYKSHPGEVHGEIETSLKQYALARGFGERLDTPIANNSDFVECNPDESSIFAVSPENADPWIVDGMNVAEVFRPLSKYPIYGL